MFINPALCSTQQQFFIYICENINAPSIVCNILSMIVLMQDGAIIQFTSCNLYPIIRFKSPLPLTLLLSPLSESNEWLYNSRLVYNVGCMGYAITLSQQFEQFIHSRWMCAYTYSLRILTHFKYVRWSELWNCNFSVFVSILLQIYRNQYN